MKRVLAHDLLKESFFQLIHPWYPHDIYTFKLYNAMLQGCFLFLNVINQWWCRLITLEKTMQSKKAKLIRMVPNYLHQISTMLIITSEQDKSLPLVPTSSISFLIFSRTLTVLLHLFRACVLIKMWIKNKWEVCGDSKCPCTWMWENNIDGSRCLNGN
jgi:hypothetical protein